MLLGTTILAAIVDFNPVDTVVYTPWFPRRGDALTSSCDILVLQNDSKVQVALMHKDPDETGGGTVNSATGTTSATSVGVITFTNTGCKLLVRYRITLTSVAAVESATLYAHLRMLVPAWAATGEQGHIGVGAGSPVAHGL